MCILKIQWIHIFFSIFLVKILPEPALLFPIFVLTLHTTRGPKNGSHSNCKGPNSQDINSHFVIQTNEPSLLLLLCYVMQKYSIRLKVLCFQYLRVNSSWQIWDDHHCENVSEENCYFNNITTSCYKLSLKRKNFGCLSFPPFLYTYPFSTRKVESCTKIQQSGTQKVLLFFGL